MSRNRGLSYHRSYLQYEYPEKYIIPYPDEVEGSNTDNFAVDSSDMELGLTLINFSSTENSNVLKMFNDKGIIKTTVKKVKK